MIDSDDSMGRAFLACFLGQSILMKTAALCQMVVKALSEVKNLKHPRSMAYLLIGCSNLVQSFPEHSQSFEILNGPGKI